MTSSAVTAEPGDIEVFSWLKTLPLAPEFHPTLAEFQDPIAYIFKIEKEASKYGICKIVPPLPAPAKKTLITNLNTSIAARSTSSNPKSSPTFTTRQQQIGFCPRKHRPVQKPVWQSGEDYTVSQFTAKAKLFEKNYLKKIVKKTLSPLEIETLYWKANGDKPFSVEYANDMPGSAFAPLSGKKETGDYMTVGDTAWNMRGVSRAKGSLLRFMKEEIPGVTSPMVYIAMMFSWFAWHVEDHDLHSLNYMHMGAGKTWYGVPRDAAIAFEDVIKVQGYGGEINPLVTFAILGEKTTVMSPEVLISAGVPCCRLVQNAGEFVVTFPRAYHSGFSHGFNCGEAANIATPEWLRFAKEAAIRRASINCPPMVSNCQLLYDLALSLSSRFSSAINSEPRSSRLKDRKKGEGETLIKEFFVEDAIRNNELLHILGKGSSIVLLPQNSLDDAVDSTLDTASRFKGNPGLSFGFGSSIEETKTSGSLVSDNFMLNRRMEVKKLSGLFTGKVNDTVKTFTSPPLTEKTSQGNKLYDKGLFSCVTCGILSFACVAIVQPREAAIRHFMSADSSIFSNRVIVSGSTNDGIPVTNNHSNFPVHKSFSGRVDKSVRNGLFDVPIQSVEKMQIEDRSEAVISDIEMQTASTALGLLASAYVDSSDSDEEQVGDKVREHSPNLSFRADEDFSAEVEVESSIRDESNIVETDVTNSSKVTCKAISHTFENGFGSDDDSSRLHVFCLRHAAEVEKLLRPIGGSHIMLLCHPDYPELESAAKLAADELGIDYIWNDITFKEATKEDEEKIQLSLESEEALHGNGDWAVKLDINLYYSAILSRSPLYSKQMPYNSIIYKAFGRSSPSTPKKKLKVYGRSSGRQKKIKMAGKWCGKVWMSNQAHPLLVEKDFDEQEEDIEQEQEEVENEDRSLYSWGRSEVKLEILTENETRNREIPTKLTIDVASSSRRSARKRKQVAESVYLKKEKRFKMEELSDESLDQNQIRSSLRNQRKLKQETDNAVKTSKPPKKPPVAKSAVKKAANMDSQTDGKKKKGSAGLSTTTNNNNKKKTVEDEGGEHGCDIEGCMMSFGSKQELVLHKRNICPIKGCGKKFFSHKYLVQHRRVHVDERPLGCPWNGCKMTFKWAWARTEHIRVHTGERPYVCTSSGCGQTFRFVSDFSRHKRKTGHSPKKGRG
ncbi:lysine-specific demethylase JMJ705-like isoform X2 [Impatiens glandulifera]|uniref:lysine-specific demethylase JMJ705-like isoform X2 n=1 Tax=Impatiens glandulifera TaxID=253017 RepID=UPI001FB0F0D9|nr:lysine-specific demethylase JMJ705-like isoform X2 [Impatiens glandulifera]